jgi:phage terminase large subunit-like protein
LAGYSVYADRPTGDKDLRADSYSVQVNNGNFRMLRGDWNYAFLEEHRLFPFSTNKDQVDAASGAFNNLAKRRIARRIT